MGDNEGPRHVFSHSVFVGLRKKPEAHYIARIAALDAARRLGAHNTYFYEPYDKVARKVRFKREKREEGYDESKRYAENLAWELL